MLVKEEHCQPIEIFRDKLLKLGKVCTSKEKQTFVLLCQEFNDVFAWKYEDLKGFNLALAQHTIELEVDAKPVR